MTTSIYFIAFHLWDYFDVYVYQCIADLCKLLGSQPESEPELTKTQLTRLNSEALINFVLLEILEK